MGGADKGLQLFGQTPLALHALQRLQVQQGGWMGPCMINANRHLPQYQAFGVPVWPDTLADAHGPLYAGPLAGLLTGLAHCPGPWLLSVPCDCPRFPLDLATRMAHAVLREGAEMAMAAAPDASGQLRRQPVFCLVRVALRDSLARFLRDGGRKVGAWADSHHWVQVPFNAPHDDPRAFSNANTPEELHALEAE
jgi:molybdopterin-guanine dinucleotide biosynthesis protein A